MPVDSGSWDHITVMKKLFVTDWRLLLFGFLMSFWSSPGQTFFISLFSGAIREELSLSHGQFGGIYSLATLLSAVVIIWTGPQVDRIDLRKFSSAIIIGTLIGCWSVSLSHTTITLFLGLFIVRHLGQGLSTLTSVTTMVRYLEQYKGKATAISSTGYSFAEAIMPSFMIALLVAVGWRTTWQLVGVAASLMMIPAIYMLLKNHSARHLKHISQLKESVLHKAQGSRQWSRKEVLRDKRFYLYMPGLLAQSMLFTGFIFHQIHLVESKGWSLVMWAGLFTLYASIALLFTVVSGYLVDRIGAIKLVPIAPLPLGAGLLLLSVSSAPSAAVLFMILLGVTSGFINTISGPFWSEMYGSRHLGSIKSLSTALMVFASSLSPFILGWLIDQGVGIETLTFGGAVYVAISFVLAVYAYRSGTNIARYPT